MFTNGAKPFIIITWTLKINYTKENYLMNQHLPTKQAQEIKSVLSKLSENAQELANLLDKTEYELKNSPEYLEDTDDFAYEITSFVEDELDDIDDAKVDIEGETMEVKLNINEKVDVELETSRT